MLTMDGWLERWITSNHDQIHPGQEPNWQYSYSLPTWLINDFKHNRLTPEEAAEKWSGYKP